MNIIKFSCALFRVMAVLGAPGHGLCALASFTSEARGIKFYDAILSSVYIGQSLQCKLEPLNQYDVNCVAVFLATVSGQSMLGHLAREDASYLAPLLREGFEGFG